MVLRFRLRHYFHGGTLTHFCCNPVFSSKETQNMAADEPRTGLVFLRKKRLLMVAVLLGFGGFVWLLTPKREPLYKGKPISDWVDQALRGYDSTNAYQARLEVKNIGPAAVPYLARRLRTDRKSTRLNSSHIPLSRM